VKKFIIPLFLLNFCLNNYSQTIQLSGYLPNTQTAEALAVMRYVSYPMDYSTGLPNITIPLYEIKAGDISLPITLSYHSSGFRPNEATGRIATGWTLNAEPSISREVRGLNDGASNGFFNYNPELFKITHGDGVYNKRVADGLLDAMSDIYFYRLADKSGSFFARGGDKQPVSQPYDDVKISASFTVEDDRGIVYEFGGDGYTERTVSMYLPLNYLCKSITSRMTRARVSFVYNYSGLVNYDYRSYTHNDVVIIGENTGSLSYPLLTRKINGMQRKYSIQGANSIIEVNNGPNFNPPIGSAGSSETVETLPLREIRFDQGSVIFEGDNRTCIDIMVRDKAGNTVKEILLYCSPYKPYGNQDMQHRKLDSIRIGAPGGEMQKYSFEYYSINRAPDRDSRSIDYWGYFNGLDPSNSNAKSLVPGFSTVLTHSSGQQFTYEHSGMDRTPNLEGTRTGVLSKITDPNGAETIFEYEGNKTGTQHRNFYIDPYNLPSSTPPGIWIDVLDFYSPQFCIDFPVGGLRIKQIRERDPVSGKVLYRDFTYGCRTKYWGDYLIKDWGVPKRLVGPNAYLITQSHHVRGGSSYNTKTWYCNPVAHITFNGGTPVLYSRVTERKWNGSDGSMWTEYYYTTPEYDTFKGKLSYNSGSGTWAEIFATLKIMIDEERNTNIPFSFRSFSDAEYGKLQKKIDYVEEGTEKRMVRQVEYTNEQVRAPAAPMYSDYVYRYRTYTDMISQMTEAAIAAEEGYFTAYPYPEDAGYSYFSIVNQEKITDYFPDGSQVDQIKNFTYTNLPNGYPKQTKARSAVTLLGGSKQKEEYFTYADGRYTLTGYPESLFPALSQHPGGILTEHKTVIGPDTTYMRRKLEQIGTGLFQVKSVKTKSAPGNNFDEVLSMKHDYYGNITETTGLDGVPTAYVWSYSSQYIVAKIENATIQSVANALPVSLESISILTDLTYHSNIFDLLNGLRNSLPNAHVYTYLYKSLVGMTSETDPSGKTTYYEYDSSNRLKRIFLKERNSSGVELERNIESYNYNFKK
jgi:YD repeat-containing protein